MEREEGRGREDEEGEVKNVSVTAADEAGIYTTAAE